MTKFANPLIPLGYPVDPIQSKIFYQDLLEALRKLINNLNVILDAGIDFDDNIDCVFVTYTSNVTPNTQDTVAHGLGKIPVAFIPIDINKASVIYKSASSTASSLFLKCNVASTTVTLLVF